MKSAREKLEDILDLTPRWNDNTLTVGNAEICIQHLERDEPGKVLWHWSLFINGARKEHIGGGWTKTEREAKLAGLERWKLWVR